MNGISNTFIPNTLSGLEAFNATNITINGVDISSLFVPFVNSPSDVDLADKNLTTSGRIQTAILKLPSVTYGATRVLQVDINKEVQSIELNGVYVTYTGSTANLDMGTNAVKSSYVPIANEDMVNKRYADITLLSQTDAASTYLSQANAAIIYLPYTGSSANLNLGSFRAYTTAVPVASNELVNKQYTDATFPDFSYLSSNYLSLTGAAATYLSITNAASTYLTQTNAATTYLTQTNAAIIYLTQSDAASTYVPQSIIVFYAPLASPTFTGIPSAPTATAGTNTTQIATTAFVQAAVGGAGVASFSAGSTGFTPNTATTGAITLSGTLNIANGGTGVTTSTGSGSVVLSASPTLTGTPLAPTAAPGTNTTQLATTAFVTAAVGGAGVSSFSAGSTGFTPSTATTGAITLAGTLNVANGGTGVTTSTGTTSVVLSASPTLTGTPLAPTATAGTNTTQIATTAFVTTAVSAVGIPTQINATATNTGTLYPVFLTSTAGGASTTFVESDGSMNYDPANNILNLPRLTATIQIQSPTYSNGSGQTVSINASGGAIAGNQVIVQIQGTTYYYFDQNAFYLTQPTNNVISSILNDLYLLWPSGKLLSFNNWATFDNTGLYMSSTRKIQAQYFETQPSQNLHLNVPTSTNYTLFQINSINKGAVTNDGFWLPVSPSTSFWITDNLPRNSTSTFGRYFGVSNSIYQDFSNRFMWRTTTLAGTSETEAMYLRSSGLNIPKSTPTHPDLDTYELVVGNNSAAEGDSAKIIVRGKASITTSGSNKGPSIDFTAWNTHATPQASIEVVDDNLWGGIFRLKAKANGAGASGAMTEVLQARVTGFRFQADPQFGVNDASYVYASDSASNLYRVCQQQTFQFNQDGAAWTAGVVLGSFAKRDGGSKVSWVASATQYSGGAATLVFQVAFTNVSTGTVYSYNQNTFTNIGSAHWVCPNINMSTTIPAGTYAVSVSGNAASDPNDYVRLQVTISPA
jgi:hypothetical protein